MDKYTAKEILGMDKQGAEYDLETQYNRYRDLYFPPFFEITTPRNEFMIKQQMHNLLECDTFIEYNKYVCADYVDIDKNNVDPFSIKTPPAGVLAFLKFGEVCDAYHTLKNDKNYPEYPLVKPDTHDFDKKNQNKSISRIRKFLGGFISLGIFNLILLFIFTAFIQIPRILVILGCVHVLQWACAWLYSPLDMLLVIPRHIWNGIKWGKKRWVLLLPVLLVCAIVCAAWGILVFVAFPAACVLDRSNKIESKKRI